MSRVRCDVRHGVMSARWSGLRGVLMAGTLVCGVSGVASGQAASVERDLGKLLEDSPAYGGPGITGQPLGPGGAARLGFSAGNTTLMSWLSLADFPGDQESGNDCWGYTSPSGREYAIIGLRNAFGFVEVTDPANPVIVGMVPGATSLWRDVKVVGDRAYGVNEAGNGIQVMDLSRIDEGIVRHVQDRRQQGHRTTHNIAANPDSGYLYLLGGNVANGGLVAVSTSNPDNPTIVGAWNTRYLHDAHIVSFDEGPYAGRELAYCCNGTKIWILDVTNKSNMYQVSQLEYTGAKYCHQGWLSADRRYFYVNDEFDEVRGRDVTTTHIFDVSDIENPSYAGSGTSGMPASDHNNYWHDGKLYQANYRSGLQVLDASDPLNLHRIAWFDTHPETDNAGFAGSWSCFPFFDSGTVIISDMQRGLFVVRLGAVCDADFNGDGAADTTDVLEYLNAWAAGDPLADTNGDGVVNTQDLSEFLNVWTVGCG